MSDRKVAVAEMKASAERILSQRFGGQVQLDEGDDLGGSNRSYVYRYVVVDGPSEVPASSVVKKIRSQRVGESGDAELEFFNDWAGLEFLAELEDGWTMAPQCYGGDQEAGIFAMQDLGSPRRLDHVLLAEDEAEAEEALMHLAVSLGRMHAMTIGKQELFAAKRAVLGPTKPYSLGWLRVRTRELEEVLDLGIGPEVNEQIDECIEALETPGPFTAFTHCDPCPDNALWIGGGIKLLDFKKAAYRHALLDGTYGRIHFPNCGCVNRIPGHIPLRMEDAYRQELIAGCPQAEDDTLYYQAVVHACARGVLGAWWPKLMEEDGEWGLATYRQRVLLHFSLFSQLIEECGQLEALGRWVGLLGSRLREAWGEGEAMPDYPAFRGDA